MTKILSSLILTFAMAGLVSTGGMAPAQEKKDLKDTKKDSKKEAKEDKSAKTHGTIEINEGKDGKFRFLIRDAEGKSVAMSLPSGFEKKEDAVKAVEALKELLPTAKMGQSKKGEKSEKSEK